MWQRDDKEGKEFSCSPVLQVMHLGNCPNRESEGTRKTSHQRRIFAREGISAPGKKKFFSLYGFELLSPSSEYQGVFSPLRVICKGGHETTVKFNNFLSEAPKGKGNCMQCLKERKRKPWDEIVAKFQEKNCEILLEQKDYKGNKQDIPYRCHCGREGTVRLGNMGEKWIGCPKCSKKRERVPWSVVEETVEVDGCILDTKEEDYRNNEQKLYVLCGCCKDKTYEIYFPVSLKEFRKGKRCPDCLEDRREAVFMELYGVKNPSQYRPFMEKAEETRLQKFGVRHVMQRKDFVEKAQRTNMEKYGLKYAFMSQETHEKIVETMLEKYGKKCFLGTDEFKAELVKRYGDECFVRTKEYKAIMKEKFGQEYYVHCEEFKGAMLERYGVEHAFQCPQIYQKYVSTIMQRYGVRNPMQCPEIFEKCTKNSYKTKVLVLPSGKEFLYQGYENFCISDLLEREGYSEEDIATRSIPHIPYFFRVKNTYIFPTFILEKRVSSSRSSLCGLSTRIWKKIVRN
ncbi:zinc-ribbon-containing protein [Marseillevirus marseillevirus]|uniref:Zinc-ribbon-containing protein n=1 Tax=Marseillevirus marseillevirus TaxID=694581 RepID=D2XAY4_GBMV|nr:zinc-ribbon-containing protein [Marseillevirus marseillevirus]ADB04111.1 zinc-ribbon-containing protein [Marseillevirus marseillevirus]